MSDLLNLLTPAGRPVFEHRGRTVTAGEMLSLTGRIVAGLRATGIGPGCGVAVRLGVHPAAFAALLACFTLGVRVIGVRAGLSLPADLDLDEERLASLLSHPDRGLTVTARPGDVARVILTSGSTGRPKGCRQTYAALNAGWAAVPSRWPPAIRELAGRLDRFLVFGSLNSQVMWEYATLTLAAGGTLVTADPPGLPAAAARHRATAQVITVGKLNQLVRAAPPDVGPLRALLVSGSPLPPARLAAALDLLGPIVFHGYGQTETGMISMLTPAETGHLDTVGRPPPAVSTRLRDGELHVRTPTQAIGYQDDPSETAAVFQDGWVRTRDLATLDADGYLHLTGRTRDIIIVHATLVHAAAVEAALCSHPAIAEAYVTGAPDDDTGEAVHAFIVPAGSPPPSPAELRAWVASRLGEAAAPATVTAIDEVPVTAAGKPDKRALLGSTTDD
ncbi:class I adenylate-forming enzyme family protein [Actinoplanes sp. NPDC049265]|uniref:class I adenylate-forming enzyme family protein n=1 Tax=Actinoplanes sp. NPDC049265 TaxID=3363902 RepID=UPI003710B63D